MAAPLAVGATAVGKSGNKYSITRVLQEREVQEGFATRDVYLAE